jgi:exopolyphosphatase / guanosine-5'-triphosphate,3'-diphosphate pyrophosphatase
MEQKIEGIKRAVIDLGTNSVLLLIGQSTETGEIHVLQQAYRVSRLGERVFDTGELQVQAGKRTLAVLQRYARVIHKHQVQEVHLIGTEALRRAANADRFKETIRKQLGWDLRILSEAAEARFGYLGALDAIDSAGRDLLVADVGGGSTEIGYGQGARMRAHISLPLGAVLLAESLGMKRKLDLQDQRKVRKIIRRELATVRFPDRFRLPVFLIGTGGTITTLAAISKNLKTYSAEKINGYVLNKNEISEIFKSLNRMTLSQRQRLTTLIQGREDVILYGSLIFMELMEVFGLNSIITTDRGLRFGYLRYMAAARPKLKVKGPRYK